MALHPCPECRQQVSEFAQACPSCGFPLSEAVEHNHTAKAQPSGLSPGEPHPVPLNAETPLGKGLVNWTYDCVIPVTVLQDDNPSWKGPFGGMSLALHTHGISLNHWHMPMLQLHMDTIDYIDYGQASEIVERRRSLFGRALVGGMLFGRTGAVIGAMSAMSQTDQKDVSYLHIDYHIASSGKAYSLLLRGRIDDLRRFMSRYRREMELTRTTGRTPQPDGYFGCTFVGLIIVGWVVLLYKACT